MDKDYKRLLVVGITYNKVERGVYALILQELGGTRRLPIVIGMAEAQSIECKLQEIITPRPLTHDLIVNIMRAFGLGLNHVVVKQLDGGIFATDLHLTDGEREVIIDSRSSDGISIALRMGVPIYAKEELLDKVGFSQQSRTTEGTRKAEAKISVTARDDRHGEADLDKMTTEQLVEEMNRSVEAEEYEKAAKIKALIEARNHGQNADKDAE